MRLDGNRIYIRRLELADTEALLDLRVRNRDFFQIWEPTRPDAHYALDAQREIIEGVIRDWENRSGYQFGIFLQETDELIGRVNYTGAVWGPFQSINLGYFLDEAHNGKGYVTEALRLGMRYVFEEAGLHRVQAGVMPRNAASVRVLEKVGLRQEGHALRYLKINGEWEDHMLFAMTSEEWSGGDIG